MRIPLNVPPSGRHSVLLTPPPSPSPPPPPPPPILLLIFSSFHPLIVPQHVRIQPISYVVSSNYFPIACYRDSTFPLPIRFSSSILSFRAVPPLLVARLFASQWACALAPGWRRWLELERMRLPLLLLQLVDAAHLPAQQHVEDENQETLQWRSKKMNKNPPSRYRKIHGQTTKQDHENQEALHWRSDKKGTKIRRVDTERSTDKQPNKTTKIRKPCIGEAKQQNDKKSRADTERSTDKRPKPRKSGNPALKKRTN